MKEYKDSGSSFDNLGLTLGGARALGQNTGGQAFLFGGFGQGAAEGFGQVATQGLGQAVSQGYGQAANSQGFAPIGGINPGLFQHFGQTLPASSLSTQDTSPLSRPRSEHFNLSNILKTSPSSLGTNPSIVPQAIFLKPELPRPDYTGLIPAGTQRIGIFFFFQFKFCTDMSNIASLHYKQLDF